MPRAGNLRTIVSAIVALGVALPVLIRLEHLGLVIGDPVVVSLLVPLTILVASTGGTRTVVTAGGARPSGSAALEERHTVRMLLSTGLIAVLCWNAGWSLLVPAGVVVTTVPLLQRSSVRMAVTTGITATILTVLGEVAVTLDWLPSVVGKTESHVAAAVLLGFAWLGGTAVAREARNQRGYAHALARAEARLRALMESSTDVLTVSNGGGVLTYVSPAAERAMGYRPADLLGRPLLDIVDAEHRPAVAARLSELMQRGEDARSSMDVLVVHASLERRWYEWTFHNMLSDRLVEGMVVQQRDVSERLTAQRALASAASTDDLTGLPNRGELLRRMKASLPQAGPGAAVAVLFVDLDLFKDVNDHLGHQAGDDVLVVVSKRLASSLRAHDHLGRLGGDEFGVLLTEVRDVREVRSVVSRLVTAIEQPITLKSGTVRIGASVGYAISADPRMPLDRLLAAADQRMYQIKANRRRSAGVPPLVPTPDAPTQPGATRPGATQAGATTQSDAPSADAAGPGLPDDVTPAAPRRRTVDPRTGQYRDRRTDKLLTEPPADTAAERAADAPERPTDPPAAAPDATAAAPTHAPDAPTHGPADTPSDPEPADARTAPDGTAAAPPSGT